jgi:hypothetical protein
MPRGNAFFLVLVLVAVGLALAAPRAALAQGAPPADASAEALRLKASADQAMNERRHLDALALYDRAYVLAPLPEILFNRGRALEALGRYPEALETFERFDKEAPAEVRARVPRLSGIIEETGKRVTTLLVRTDVQNARILVRGVQVATTPTGSVRVVAGRATIEVLAEGHETDRRDLDLPGGGTVVIDARLPERAALAGPVPDDRSSSSSSSSRDAPLTSRWWFWTAVGVVVVSGIVVTVGLTRERSADTGSYPPGRISAPLVRF